MFAKVKELVSRPAGGPPDRVAPAPPRVLAPGPDATVPSSHLPLTRQTPGEVRLALLDELLGALRAHGVEPFLVRGSRFPGLALGVREEQRSLAVAALAESVDHGGLHLREVYPDVPEQAVRPVSRRVLRGVPARCDVLDLARVLTTPDGSLTYGMENGVSLEFWRPDDSGARRAPRPNAAALSVAAPYLDPTTTTVQGREVPTIGAFARPSVADVAFPVDVVYTWVDGDDPAWRERMGRARAAETGEEYHPQSVSANRFTSRDELRYSLRSLAMYAPWVNHVHLVTDGQCPSWLDPDHPWITLLDHRDVFTDPSVLPVFNSNAIISQLHHVPGLSEHYLYLNDDMFFGNHVRPEDFWFGNGVAKVFPSRQTRPFGVAHAGESPHVNITTNIRRLLEDRLGVSVSLAIRHTPYPQIRSVNEEIEQVFSDVLTRTAGHRFRHADDIALDQMFHYYAQATGRAVASSISYDYVNVGDVRSRARLRRLLGSRGRTVFCLNDAPEPDTEPLDPREVVDFLEAYFPVPSPMERRGPTPGGATA